MPGSVHSGSASWDNCGWMFPVFDMLSYLPWWSLDTWQLLCSPLGATSHLPCLSGKTWVYMDYYLLLDEFQPRLNNDGKNVTEFYIFKHQLDLWGAGGVRVGGVSDVWTGITQWTTGEILFLLSIQELLILATFWKGLKKNVFIQDTLISTDNSHLHTCPTCLCQQLYKLFHMVRCRITCQYVAIKRERSC